jgi:gluconolactonase
MRACLFLLMLFAATGADGADVPLPSTVQAGAELVEVYAAPGFYEGPTWDPAGKKLYFTAFLDQGVTQILRLDSPRKVTVWLDQSKAINGTFLSREGRLLGAKLVKHQVIDFAFGADGPEDSKVLYENKDLCQPNDICQTPNGDIYFTDPDFGKREKSGVYLLRGGKGTKIIHDMALPNGIIASLDGQTLYVADSFDKHWRAYPIKPDGTTGPGRTFFDPETENKADPDGMSIDAEGNLYFTGRGGVWAVTPAGKSLGFIPVSVFCSNVTFGGDDGQTLYITCANKVYSLTMKVPGPIHEK